MWVPAEAKGRVPPLALPLHLTAMCTLQEWAVTGRVPTRMRPTRTPPTPTATIIWSSGWWSLGLTVCRLGLADEALSLCDAFSTRSQGKLAKHGGAWQHVQPPMGAHMGGADAQIKCRLGE